MSYINFNSEIIPATKTCILANDRGLTLGHGLFETILIKKNAIPAFTYHWKRLEASAPCIGICIPFSHDELEWMLLELIEKNALHDKIATARLTITSGNSPHGILPASSTKPNVCISVFEHVLPLKTDYSAMVVNIRKNEYAPSARIKSTSYLDNILAKQEAVMQGYDEAILLNTANHVADGAVTNVFMVKDQRIFTPRIADGALPGVIRTILLNEFGGLFDMTETTITLTELMTADEVFLTNAIMGIKPLLKLNEKVFYVVPHTQSLQRAFQEKKDYL